MSVATMSKDRPLIGILLMLGFCVLAPLGDSMAKLLGPHIPVGQLVTIRFAFQALLLIPLALLLGQDIRLTGRVLWLTLVRTIAHVIGIGTMFAALGYLPIADAIAIVFVMPFIMLLLGWLVLGEEVGPYRLGACAVGFFGTLLVVQPNFAEVGWPAFIPLATAVAFAVFMLVTRSMAKEVPAVAMQGVSGVMALVVLLPVLALGPDWPILEVVAPGRDLWGLILLLGLIGTFGHFLMTWSLRFAPAATLAPMQYLEIPFAALIGWAIFSDLPNGLAALGIVISVASGLFVIARERAIATRPPQPPAPPAA